MIIVYLNRFVSSYFCLAAMYIFYFQFSSFSNFVVCCCIFCIYIFLALIYFYLSFSNFSTPTLIFYVTDIYFNAKDVFAKNTYPIQTVFHSMKQNG